VIVATITLLLAGIFAVAALGKLLDLRGTQAAVVAFGVPERLARPAAIGLPLAEMLVATTLLIHQTATAGAIGAVVLLGMFTFVIARSVVAGETLDCHCFGQLHSAPTSSITLGRNLVLLALASGLAVAGPSSTWTELRDADATELALAITSILALVLAGTTATLWETTRRLRDEAGGRAAEGLPPGAPAPSFAATTADGVEWSLDDLARGDTPIALVLVHAGCAACHDLVPRLARWAPSLREHLTLAVVSAGPFEAPLGDDLLVLEADGFDVAASYATMTTPAAIFIDQHRRVSAPAALGVFAIESSVREILAAAEPVATGTEEPASR